MDSLKKTKNKGNHGGLRGKYQAEIYDQNRKHIKFE